MRIWDFREPERLCRALSHLGFPEELAQLSGCQHQRASGLCTGSAKDLHGGELKLLRFPCQSLKDFSDAWVQLAKRLQGEMSIYYSISHGRSCWND